MFQEGTEKTKIKYHKLINFIKCINFKLVFFFLSIKAKDLLLFRKFGQIFTKEQQILGPTQWGAVIYFVVHYSSAILWYTRLQRASSVFRVMYMRSPCESAKWPELGVFVTRFRKNSPWSGHKNRYIWSLWIRSI